jgi:NADH-quinone oxidoreductase subunit F
MLVQVIPPYRLPRGVLEREIRMIEDMGVSIVTDCRLGRDITLDGLESEGWEALFLGVGAAGSVSLGLDGEEAEGCVQALSFLRDFNLGRSSSVGKRVVVIGGGNAAIDAARTALRLGADRVSVLYRRTRNEMPAYEEEVREAEREGIRLDFLTTPCGVIGENGKLSGIKCLRMRLGPFDRSGRRRPEPSGEELILQADQVIVAIGQTVDLEGCMNGRELRKSPRNTVEVDPGSGQTSAEWIFAGGDVVTGPASVVDAVAGGERAAAGIDRFLTGENHAFWRAERAVDTFFDPDADPVGYGRAAPALIPVKDRLGGFREVERCIRKEAAVREAKRCLRCDYREETEEERRGSE